MNWNLELIYKTNDDFNNDLNFLKENISKISTYQNKLNNSKVLAEFMLLNEELELKLSKLFTYSHMQFDLNQKNMEAMQQYQIVYSVYNELVIASSFIDSELLSIGKEKLLEYVNTEPELERYRFYVTKLFDNQEHILSGDKELLLSYFNAPLSNFNNMYDKLAVSDNSSTMVKLSTGEEVEINESNFRGYLEKCSNPIDRKNVFDISQKLQDIAKEHATINVLNAIQNYILQVLKTNPKQTRLIEHIAIIESAKKQAELGIKPVNIFDDLCLKLIN